MVTLEDRVPVDDLAVRARDVQLSRVVLTLIGAIATAIGWAIGRAFISIGWAVGRGWLIAAYFAEAVIYGFRMGAKLPPPAQSPPGTSGNP